LFGRERQMASKQGIGRAAAAVALASGLFSGATGATAARASTDSQTYIVLYNQMAVPSDAASSLARAGGRLIQAYNEIGVAIASSGSPTFRDSARQDSRVQDAGATSQFAVRLKDRVEDDGRGPAASSISTPGADKDNLSA